MFGQTNSFDLAKLVPYFPQKFFPFFDVFLCFYAFAFQAIYYAYDSSSLFSFGDDDFQWVGGGRVDRADFGSMLDLVQNVQWVGAFEKDYEAVATCDFEGFFCSNVS